MQRGGAPAPPLGAQAGATGRPLPGFHTRSQALYIVAGQTWQPGAGSANPAVRPDIYETPARRVTFLNPSDTLTLDLQAADTADFVVVTAEGDAAFTHVVKAPGNPYAGPPAQMTQRLPDGRLTRARTAFDINALVCTLGQVRPDLSAVCRQEDLMRAVAQAKVVLPDTLTRLDLYRLAAPLLTMLGGGHTMTGFPYNDVFAEQSLRRPLYVDLGPGHSLVTRLCTDSIIPAGPEIRSINGHSAAEMLQTTRPCAGGERDFFRLEQI